MPPSLPAGTTWEPGTGNKKYRVTVPGHGTVQFGHKDYQQYKDQTPLKLYSTMDHGDEKRRNSYRKRHEGCMKNGGRCIDDKYSPSWFSYNFLWS